MIRNELCFVILCAVFVIIYSSQLYLNTGELCPLKNNSTGVCIHLENCSSARAQVKQKQHPVLCSFEGLYPIVCCEINNAITIEENITTLSEGDICFLKNYDIGVCKPSSKCISDSNNKSTEELSNCRKDLICCPETEFYLPKLDYLQVVPVKKPLYKQQCNIYRRAFFKHQLNMEPIESIEFLTVEKVDLLEINKPEIKLLEKRQVILDTKPISGGELALLYEFPHMAAIGYGNVSNKTWLCGGSLISENFILTAAHCIYSEEGEAKYVRLGALDIRNHDREIDKVDFDIVEIIKHPDYIPPKIYNDIALLKLNRNVTFSKAILPACLHDNYTIPVTNLTATGWGHTEYGGEESDYLLKVILKSTSFEYCKSQFKQQSGGRILTRGIEDDTQFCYGGDGTDKDTCQGDSGGPLQMKIGGMYRIVGITSFGKACGIGKSPGVYTRVSAFVPWIESIIWK